MTQKIILGDSQEILKNIDSNSIDLVITSPPYDDLRTYNHSSFTFDNFQKIAIELKRVIKQNCPIIWVVSDSSIGGTESCSSFKQALYFREIGFDLHDTMIFLKENQRPRQYRANRYEQIFEYMFVFSKGKPKTFNPIKEQCKHSGKEITFTSRDAVKENLFTSGDILANKKTVIIKDFKTKGNVWKYNTGNNTASSKCAFKHPAIFPEELVKDHILSWSNENDVILDPFAGSGTTGFVAKKLNRHFILIEKEKEYYDIIMERLNEITDNK